MAHEGITWRQGYQRFPRNQTQKKKAKQRFVGCRSEMSVQRRKYLVPVQQEALYNSPDYRHPGRGLDLFLRRRDLRPVPCSDRVAKRYRPLHAQMDVGDVVLRDARGAFDVVQEGTQARPHDRRQRSLPVLPERWVNRQGIFGLQQNGSWKWRHRDSVEGKKWVKEERLVSGRRPGAITHAGA
jgi:hypothetical protein